ncbi:MAG: hypothetical protein QM786_14835 [Breznakibacter sp.]
MQRITLSVLIGGLVVLVSTLFYNQGGKPPPHPFLFKIIDLKTGENLISNGRYQSDKLKIIYEDGNQMKEVDLKFFISNDDGVLVFSSDLARKSLDHHRFYICFDNADTDTLDIELKTGKGTNGNGPRLKDVKHNGHSAQLYNESSLQGPNQFFLITK